LRVGLAVLVALEGTAEVKAGAVVLPVAGGAAGSSSKGSVVATESLGGGT